MADEVDISELDASDLADILTEVNGKATKVKNVALARKELAGLLESKGLTLTTDDDGNFVLNPKKAAKGKAKAKAAPEPEPEEEVEEEEEEEEEPEEEVEEEEEEEAEEAPPPPPKKGKAPAPAPKAKAKVKAPEPEEEEEEEEETPKPKAKVKAKATGDGTKRAPPPREPNLKDDMAITIVNKTPKFAEGSFRQRKWDVLKKSKTVGAFMKGCEAAELPSARGYLSVCIKAEYITVG